MLGICAVGVAMALWMSPMKRMRMQNHLTPSSPLINRQRTVQSLVACACPERAKRLVLSFVEGVEGLPLLDDFRTACVELSMAA